MVGSGCLYAVTAEMNIFRLPSRVAGKDPRRWVLVDMHTPAPWVNKLLFPLIIKDKWKEPLMNDSLSALVKHVAELCEAGLKAYHCIKECHLRQIHPLGHRDKLAFECPQMANPSRDPADGQICFLLNCR
jgi:hypothetical protein